MVTTISSVISAVISGIVALLVSSQQHKTTMEQTREENSKAITLIEYRLKQLEDKVDKHNNSVERLAILEAKFNMMASRHEHE